MDTDPTSPDPKPEKGFTLPASGDSAFSRFVPHYFDYELADIEKGGHVHIPMPAEWIKKDGSTPELLSPHTQGRIPPFSSAVRGEASEAAVIWFDAGLLGDDARKPLTQATKRRLQADADLLAEGFRDAFGIEPLEARFVIPDDALRSALGYQPGAALVLATTSEQEEHLQTLLFHLDNRRDALRAQHTPASLPEWISRWQAPGATTADDSNLTTEQADLLLSDLIAQKQGKFTTAYTDYDSRVHFRGQLPLAHPSSRRWSAQLPAERKRAADNTTGLVLWLKPDGPMASYHRKYGHTSPELKDYTRAVSHRFGLEVEALPITLPAEHGADAPYGLLLRSTDDAQHHLLHNVKQGLQSYVLLNGSLRNQDSGFTLASPDVHSRHRLPKAGHSPGK